MIQRNPSVKTDFFYKIPWKLIWIIFLPGIIQAQREVRGVVCNAADKKPVPYATISVDGIKYITDADGFFSCTALGNLAVISRSGFKSDTLQFKTDKSFYTIGLLKYSTIDSKGRELMAEALKRVSSNNPLELLESFRFEAYSKLLVTANPDSIRGEVEIKKVRSIFGLRNKIDSSQYKIKQLMLKQHFFATEKSAVFEYDGRYFKETVNGTRMSGFKEPLSEVMGLSFQSFGLYKKDIELFETSYESPLSKRGLHLYDFRLLDSLNIDGRPTYLIYFKDRRSRKTAGLEGALYLDAQTLAVAKSVIRVLGLLHITAAVEYEWQPQGFWFPSKRSFSIRKGTGPYNIKILGETIRFDEHHQESKLASDYTELLSESVYGAFRFNIPLKIRRKSLAIEVKSSANIQSDKFWQPLRPCLPDKRELATYSANDSLVAREKIEKKLKWGRKLINGYLPFRSVDIDIRQVISYNNFEGFRIGLGGITNDRFSNLYRTEAYFAMGTKDEFRKYSLGEAARIGQFSNTWIGISFTDDIKEIASTTFATDKRIFKLYDPRPFNITTFYRYQSLKGFIESKIIPKTDSYWQVSRAAVIPLFSYSYLRGDRQFDYFTLTTASVAFQWNPFSDFMQTPAGRFETEKRFPKFSIQYTKALRGFFDGDLSFSKIDLRAEYEKSYLDGQKTAITIQGGYATGDAPITHLYSTSPNNLNKDAVLQRINFAGKNSFETMYFNEFFSSQFVSFQFKHQFKPFSIIGKLKLVPVAVTRMAWGMMEKPERHLGITYKTLNDGFFESGIELNKIFKVFGFSAFYRYGPNQLSRFEDNLALKVSFVLDLGF